MNKSNNVVETVPQAVLASSIYVPGPAYINPKICPDNGSTLQLLIVIPSAPSHHEARMAVRQTWGHFNNRRDVSIAFMLGITKNSSLQNQINSEEYLYGDIIQGKFMDTYDNLTLKTIAILEWVDNYCSNVAFVLKTDDDMFINVPKLLTFISKHNKNNRVIYGRLAKKWKPIRNKKSKYYISRQQYKPAVFPDFTTGPAYLISSCVIHDLYLAALNHTYFKLEDVFITGIVAHYINVKRIHVNEFLNKRVSLNTCNIQKGISIHMVRYHEQFDVWKRLFEDSAKCT